MGMAMKGAKELKRRESVGVRPPKKSDNYSFVELLGQCLEAKSLAPLRQAEATVGFIAVAPGLPSKSRCACRRCSRARSAAEFFEKQELEADNCSYSEAYERDMGSVALLA